MGGSHYLNLVCTPAKGVSYRIAGRVFAATPRLEPYPEDAKTEIGTDSWHASYPNRRAALMAPDALMYSGPGGEFPYRGPSALREIVGWGNSPAVRYDGTGSYRIAIEEDELRVRLFPDVAYTRPVWQRPSANPLPKLCVIDTETPRRLEILLPGWRGIPLRAERTDDAGRGQPPVTGRVLSLRPGTYRITRETNP